MIKVTYSSIDRYRKTRSFKTIEGARKFAQHWIGKNPDRGSHYAVSDDGVGKITVSGATLEELFRPDDAEVVAYITQLARKDAEDGIE